jgi:ribosome-binding protein aMBF1 (putative translation factor)
MNIVAAAEDATDRAAYRAAKQRLARGEDEMVLAVFAERLLAGENPVRVFRELRGLSVKDLAARAKLSAAYLSQVETGARQGTMATRRKLARALDVALDDLA